MHECTVTVFGLEPQRCQEHLSKKEYTNMDDETLLPFVMDGMFDSSEIDSDGYSHDEYPTHSQTIYSPIRAGAG